MRRTGAWAAIVLAALLAGCGFDVVRHEMLHDLIGRAGHPDPPFGEGCPLTWATWTGTD